MAALATISTEQRRRRLGQRHLLAPEHATDDIEAIVKSLVGLHSSDPATVFLSCLARMQNPSVQAIEKALYEDRRVVRHHAMRRTIWVMTRRTTRLAHAATTAKIAAVERKRTLASMELSSDISNGEFWLDAAEDEVIELLAGGSMNTREIGLALPHLAVPLEFGSSKHSATLNAHTKVLQGAGFNGTLVRGKPAHSWNSAEYPWSTAEQWLGEPIVGLDKRDSAGELVDHWLRRFGPATETDIVWWLGDTKTLVRNALADIDAVPVLLENGEEAWVAAGDTADVAQPSPWVRLLPGLDPTSMGWKQRDFYIDPSHMHDMFDQFGNIGPAIWADGQVVGGWVQRDDASIVYRLFTKLSSTHASLLDDAVDQMQRAVGDVVVKPRFPARMQKSLLLS